MAVTKKHQVFVCSTFIDLETQRQEIFQALWKNDCIPVGMEGFVPAHMDQWNYIRNRIQESDYFIVIVAHRYGSRMPSGSSAYMLQSGRIKSITESEYDLARSIADLPISRFVIDPAESWPTDKISIAEDKADLDAFKSRLSTEKGKSYGVAFWRNATLANDVRDSVRFMIKDKERPGLVRGEDVHADLITHGIARVHHGLQHVSKKSIFSPKSKYIRIILHDGYNLFEANFSDLQEAIKAGVRTQIIITHPENKLIPIIENKSAKKPGQQKKEIIRTIKFLYDNFGSHGNVTLLGHREYICYAALICDAACMVDFYFNFRLEDRRQDRRVALECFSASGEKELFSKIYDDFEYFWRHINEDDGNDLFKMCREGRV